MTPRRLLYVLNIFPKLSETFIAGELAELQRRGVELRILSLLPPRDEIQHEIIKRAGLARITEYDIGRFAAVVKEFQPELLHAHFAKEATEKARELSTQSGVPFTFTAHGYDIHRKPPPDFHDRAMAARFVVTVSEANARYIRETFQVPGSHIHVVPCGVDTHEFCPAISADNKTEPPMIVCVARHVAVKNLGLLLDACAVLKRNGVSFRCAMVGDGPLRDELTAKQQALGLQDIVDMPGSMEQRQVAALWKRAAIGVLTSDNEGMPVSLMEAAASGVPVVATKVGGIPELVQDGETGLLVPAGDPEAFAAALERLLTNAALRQQMAANAREHAQQCFSVTRQVDSLLALWSQDLNGGTA